MLRLIDSAPTGLFTMTIAVVSAVLLVGTGLDMERHFARAQTAIQFDDGDEIYRFVREDVAAGGSVGGPVEASCGTGTLTYSVTGADAASFTIKTSTGQLLVAEGVSLDYESGKTTYRIVVTATDESKETANADVVITVDNVNEPPQFDPDNIFFDSYTVQENTAVNKNVGYAITAVDPEGGDVTYSLAGANATLFDVDSSSGQITTKTSLNYETASSHSVSFTASDPQSNSASIDLTIEVTDDDTEAPGKPAEPAVEPNSGNGHEALKVTWAVPANDGPAIKSYVVQHRIEGSASEWTPTTFTGSVLSGTATGLDTATNYEVRIRAINDECNGPWSGPITAETMPEPRTNSRPYFSDEQRLNCYSQRIQYCSWYLAIVRGHS